MFAIIFYCVFAIIILNVISEYRWYIIECIIKCTIGWSIFWIIILWNWGLL